MLLAILVTLTSLLSTFDPDAAAQAEADRQYQLAVERGYASPSSSVLAVPSPSPR
jgi:hypothetical protein